MCEPDVRDHVSRGTVRAKVCLAALGCLGLLAGAGPVAASGLQAPWDRGIVQLTKQADAVQLRFPTGSELSLPVAAETRVSGFSSFSTPRRRGSESQESWILTGSLARADGTTELVIRRGDDRGSQALPTPVRVDDPRMRTGAVPLVGVEGLAGVAWLQGAEPRSFEVWAAEWRGRRFARPRRVARAASGSQVALTGAVLRDGSWLLAWSAHDGEDDEIVYRIRQGEEWRPLAQAHGANSVPDITPRVVATADGGALLTWSRYEDGQYRAHLARLDGARSEGFADTGLGSEPGTVYPDFRGTAEVPILVYLEVASRSWELLELEPRGTVLRRATVGAHGSVGPWVEPRETGLRVSFGGTGRAIEEKITVAWSARN